VATLCIVAAKGRPLHLLSRVLEPENRYLVVVVVG
jgi:hypothetical protein